MLTQLMGMATGERLQSGRFGAAPRIGSLVIEEEVARGPASVVYAARLAARNSSGGPELARVALKAYDPELRFQHAEASRFELALDPRIARSRRRDETGELPKDRLYRATDIVRAPGASLETLGSLLAVVGFWVEVSRALGAAHARGSSHGHFRPGHALVVRDAVEPSNGSATAERPRPRPLVVDAGIVLSPRAARLVPASAAFLPPEAIEALLAGLPAPATPEGDVYALAAALSFALGGPAPGLAAAEGSGGTLEALLDAKRAARPPVVAAAAFPARAVDQRALGATLARALDPDPTKRPGDGTALSRELAGTLAEDLASTYEPDGKSGA